MGNKNGMLDSILHCGENKVIQINEENYFSFAHGDEIALKYKGHYYILNCDSKLWSIVEDKVKQTKDINELKQWWKDQSKNYEISDWSRDFDNLKNKEGHR